MFVYGCIKNNYIRYWQFARIAPTPVSVAPDRVENGLSPGLGESPCKIEDIFTADLQHWAINLREHAGPAIRESMRTTFVIPVLRDPGLGESAFVEGGVGDGGVLGGQPDFAGYSPDYFRLLAVLSQRMPPSSKFHDQNTLVTVPPIWSSRMTPRMRLSMLSLRLSPMTK
jgi:hypothetical protein